MDKTMNYLSLARKAGLAELGEEPVGAVSRTGRAYVILVAGDASDHTWRRAQSFAAGTRQQCVRLPHTKDEMGMTIGRSALAIAAITDASMALALVESLGQPEKHTAVLEVLRDKAAQTQKRKAEAKAHQRNIRKGRSK